MTQSPESIEVDYRISQGRPHEVADAIRVEQTIEFPFDLAPGWIQDEVVGRVVSVQGDILTLAFDPAVARGGLTPLLNLLWGNVSLFPGIRVTGLRLPPDLLQTFSGPRYGIPGLRYYFDVPDRALLCTALKPMGLSSDDFASIAGILARAGFDIIKDDHGLADQPWAPWRERIRTIADAVHSANSSSGSAAVYMPSLNVASEFLVDAAFEAKEAGAGALLILPGLCGMDAMRSLADEDDLALPIMAHPSFLGSHVINQQHGLDHNILFGTLMRLAGADISIFPNFDGRFSFSVDECASIRDACHEPLMNVAAAWPSPGGGMTLDRIAELLTFYGRDVTLLVGGALHRGDLEANARTLVEAVRELPREGPRYSAVDR